MGKLLLIPIALIKFLCIGWINNLMKLVDCDFDGKQTSYKTEAIRGAGVFIPPVGGVIGWFDIGDDEK